MAESAGSDRGERRPQGILPPHTRLALPEGGGFSVTEISERDFPSFAERLVGAILAYLEEAGRPLPRIALREVVDNLVHAVPCTASAVVDPSLSRIYISDTGPGISCPDHALELGFSTANELHRSLIRGVGIGLYLAREDMRALGGDLRIISEPGSGTHVCLSLDGSFGAPAEPYVGDLPDLSPRQNNILFLLSEGVLLGPTGISQELGISPSTAYRELTKLERMGLVACKPDGKRFLSESGRTYLQALLSL